jgi:hypothetical protein
MYSPLVSSSDQVDRQHSSDIRVELGGQDKAREHIMVDGRKERGPGGSWVLLLLIDSISEEPKKHESGFSVSHSLLYTSSVLPKSLASSCFVPSSAALAVSWYFSTKLDLSPWMVWGLSSYPGTCWIGSHT